MSITPTSSAVASAPPAPQAINAFFSTASRTANGNANDDREAVVLQLAEEICIGAPRAPRGHLTNAWGIVETALQNALLQIPAPQGPVNNRAITNVVRLGGRGNSHDFEFIYARGGTSHTLAVELKNGGTIQSQPQFLQVYAHPGKFTAPGFGTYSDAHFNHPQGLPAIVQAAGMAMPARGAYDANVYKTSAAPGSVLAELKGLYKADAEFRLLATNAYRASAHDYLNDVGACADTAIDWESLQTRLTYQSTKAFLLWDANTQTFAWQRLSASPLVLTRSASASAPRGSTLNHTLILPTTNGRALHALLRWKNGNGILGPAWQIKLV
ncbi:hypothetical protein [Demequina rhizosphaerae]|uniref:hypothetical protein n=1 Tax=Demequina rhizosphaerae TaxID=1638985 RepID=UPI00078633C8|nr:hypothetical protein [Demequina rhizosphaerae]